HLIRRTVATLIASKHGMGAAGTLLGHSGPAVTARYVDPSRLPATDLRDSLPSLTAAAAPAADRSKWPPENYLAEAAQLAAAGHLTAAAMTARIALERTIRKWFSLRIGGKSKGESLNSLIHRLAVAGELGQQQG